MRNLIAAALTLAFVGSVATTAQADERPSHYGQRDHGRYDHDHKEHDKKDDNRRDVRRDDRPDHHHDNYRHERHDHDRYDRHRYERNWYQYNKPPGYRYRAWRHGDRLPRAYCADRYVVHDYHAYRLRQPPRGYHWVRVDKDVILAAVATGLVAQAIYGVF